MQMNQAYDVERSNDFHRVTQIITVNASNAGTKTGTFRGKRLDITYSLRPSRIESIIGPILFGAEG